jgi:hypothetical protein
MSIEDEVRAVLANLDGQDGSAHAKNSEGTAGEGQGEPEEIKRVIHVDKCALPDGSALFRLPTGQGVLVPGDAAPENDLDRNAVESVAPVEEQDTPDQKPGAGNQKPETENRNARTWGFLHIPAKRFNPASGFWFLASGLLLCLLAVGTSSYFFLLPLMVTATVTLIPDVRNLHTDATFTIAESPKAGQVQGRPLETVRFTASKTVPATGHAHDDAMRATGVITFYNTGDQPYTIPAGETFTAPDGATIVTNSAVTVQAAILPEAGSAIVLAHLVQAGSIGNITAHSLYTRCCGSEFITATNTAPFTGGQDARDYSYVQNSDIQNAATGLLGGLTPKATAALSKEGRPGEQLVTPLCSPRTASSEEAGTAAASVTVSVTETCSSVAYLTDSLNQVATNTLAASGNLAHFEQAGPTQVTVNGSAYAHGTASLKVSLSGIWVYRFTQSELTPLKTLIAGKSRQEAQMLLAKAQGIRQASIHVQRLDFKDLLPADTSRISIQFFYVVS